MSALLLDFKSATLYTVRMVLLSEDTTALVQALQTRMAEAGSFFENETVVVDASQVEGLLDWSQLLKALRGHKLRPIGVVAQNANLKAAQKQGLVQVELSASSFASQAKNVKTEGVTTTPSAHPATEPETVDAQLAPTLIVNRQLRSGQRLYARHADLIVTGVVSQGAEIIADGNIHVYGALRGKAMAGARGNAQARIFSTDFNPELVAIAGVYQVLDSQLEAKLHRQTCMVTLDGQRLHISAVGRPT